MHGVYLCQVSTQRLSGSETDSVDGGHVIGDLAQGSVSYGNSSILRRGTEREERDREVCKDI